MTVLTGNGPTEMRELAVKLRAANPARKRELRKQMKAAAGPAVRDVQRSILDMPSRHGGHLREEVARTVYASTRITASGVRVDIVSAGRRMPQGKATLPKLLDSSRGFSHPVFARGERFHLGPSHARKYRGLPNILRPQVKRGSWTWVHQWGKPQWFERPIEQDWPRFTAAGQAALDDMKRKLGG